jgi:tetratricopeptide (TPR) repeat protein
MRNANGARPRTIPAACAILVVAAVATLAGCAPKDAGGANGASAAVSRKEQLAGGFQAFDERRYDYAIQAAEHVLADDSTGPGSAEALYLEARVHEQRAKESTTTGEAKDHLREAKGLYMRVLSTSPPQPLDAYARAGLANVSYFMDDYATAAREWAAAYPHINDADAQAWVGYRAGLSEQRRGNFAEADRHFAEVQQLFPGSEQARRAAAHQGAKGFHVQVGAYTTAANAQSTIAALKSRGLTPAKSTDLQGRQIIAVGPIPTYAQAKSVRDSLAPAYPGAVILP